MWYGLQRFDSVVLSRRTFRSFIPGYDICEVPAQKKTLHAIKMWSDFAEYAVFEAIDARSDFAVLRSGILAVSRTVEFVARLSERLYSLSLIR